jgi:hypothetical protein
MYIQNKGLKTQKICKLVFFLVHMNKKAHEFLINKIDMREYK